MVTLNPPIGSRPARPLRFVGVDACRGGWFGLLSDPHTGALQAALAPNAASLLHWARDAVVAIDMPIGLPESGQRACDVEARRLLGRPRGSSVFSAPVRPALPATDWADAHARTQAANDRAGRRPTGLSKQSFGILPRVRELDYNMTPALQRWVFEAHPELSFRAWNQDAAMGHSKRTAEGRAEREALIDAHFGADVRRAALMSMYGKKAAMDDIYDAFACLWTAQRISRGEAVQLPAVEERDVNGLLMQIRY